MDFTKIIKPVHEYSFFEQNDKNYNVWGATMARTKDGKCHLLFARWPKTNYTNGIKEEWKGWCTCCEIGYAVSDNPLGPYIFEDVVLKGAGGDAWDANSIHNPTMIEHNGKYYLYYMGNKGDGHYWNHRNNQRVGVAVANHPKGPWKRFSKPLIDITKGMHDGLMTSNPSVAKGRDGRFYIVYKAVSEEGEMPKGGSVVCGVAIADNPLGPFVKHKKPIMTNPIRAWSVEDPFIWYQDDRFYAIVKDYSGYFTRAGRFTTALFESKDGITWESAKYPLAFARKLVGTDGRIRTFANLERPQIWMENGKPSVLFCAAKEELKGDLRVGNIHIPLQF